MLVVIENDTIDRMALDPTARQDFSCLNAYVAQATNLSCCGGRRGRRGTTVQRYNEIKQCLVSMSAAKRTALKRYFKAERLRVHVRNGNRVVKYTF